MVAEIIGARFFQLRWLVEAFAGESFTDRQTETPLSPLKEKSNHAT
jgi:hypothetical protein